LILTWNNDPEIATNKPNKINNSQFSRYSLLKINNGRNFCQVFKIKNIIQFKSILNLKNQKWKGGNPIFHKILINNNRLKIILKFIIYKYEINKKIEPIAWIKKYFIPNIWGFIFFLKKLKVQKLLN